MVSNKKLCWNCEGNVHNKATQCPYCGAELIADSKVGSSHAEENLSPPYAFSNADSEDPAAIPAPPYSSMTDIAGDVVQDTADPEWDRSVDDAEISEKRSEYMNGLKANITPLLLLSLGAIYFLFSFVLLLFSHDGVLTLHWNSSYWAVYFFLSVPCLYFGWKALGRIKDGDSGEA